MNGGKIADDAKDAKQAMNAYNKVMADGPEALVGSFFSSVTLPMAEQAAKDGMLLLAAGATNSAVTLKGDTFFRNCFIDPYQGKMAALFVKGKGLSKVAVIYAKDDDYSNGLKDAFVENCESSGIEVAYVGECMTTDTDFSSQTAQAVASGAEFLYYPCFLDTVPLFVGAARNAGFTGIIMGGDGWDGSDTTGLEDKFEGCYFTNHYSSEDTAPAVVNFVEKFTAKYGTESLNACAALYYDAMYMLAEAAKNGGGTDTASLIAGMKGMSFTGVGGDIALYGLLASMFFALTFILNRSMNLGGSYWLWSASLRYLFMLPMLWLLLRRQKADRAILREIRARPVTWLVWSTVGFGLFYAPLSMASCYGESWFVAATWQITIVAGVLLTPLFGGKIPVKNLLFSAVILLGIFLLQLPHPESMESGGSLKALALILVAGISYPLGNRKMMAHCPAGISTTQRVFGMTLCSMPFWLLCSAYALLTHGLPSSGQILQSLSVALFSGVIATLLFFEATSLVRHNPKQLAVVEATQAGEVLFTLLGGILFLHDALSTPAGMLGIGVVVIGMVLNSLSG